ncbi:MAG: Bifunctional non-ous end joining protein LigD [Flaviaesturariibacter sp.]|nr:Bifunctional non-ous end joining protein LigD [Flaviaesturariibacter sp.]
MPRNLGPMLATITGEPFSDPGWQYEIKWDGYRALGYVEGGTATLTSRNRLSFNDKFKPVVEALQQWKVNAIVDGEVVILNDDGHADFGALQQWSKTGAGSLHYFVFDLLWLHGVDLRSKPLTERRKILQQILPDGGVIRYSDNIDEYGVEFFRMAKENGLEGIIAKRKDSRYDDGARSKAWLKIKAEERHEAVICGYTKKAGSDRHFSSLVLGVPDGKSYRFIGQVGTGFTQSSQQEILQRMVPLKAKQPPFPSKPIVTDPVVWLLPRLVCEVKYTELTSDGVMRHPSFQGLREDKTATDFNADTVDQTPDLVGPDDHAKIVAVNDHDLKLSNLKKFFWIKEGITKGDLLNYYSAVSPFLMPYLKDRPQSLNRFPNGSEGKNFYQKNMAGKLDPWIQTFRRVSASSLLPKYFLVCADTAHLLYMVNLGCIEINPWHSTIYKPNNPNWCVIDLDPGEIAFTKVVETALVVKDVLDSLGIVSYPKTSGSTGIHIYIPLEGKYGYDQSRQLAELVANLVHAELPAITSLERNPAKRTDKIYVDFLQNRPIQTICSPYSVRPKPGATASAPLHWSEVNNGLRIESFTMKNMMERLRAEGDLFKGVLGAGINLEKVLQQVSKQLNRSK